jgi:hypothetical protein
MATRMHGVRNVFPGLMRGGAIWRPRDPAVGRHTLRDLQDRFDYLWTDERRCLSFFRNLIKSEPTIASRAAAGGPIQIRSRRKVIPANG